LEFLLILFLIDERRGIMVIKYYIIKIIYLLTGRKMEFMLNFFRNNGVNIGKGCNIYSNILTTESYLITIKDNVTISNDVQFITHDNSICKVNPEYTDLFGEITIGESCFIGARVIILPGVTLAKNIIVGSGSVVTKSFHEPGIIIAGNPARRISNIKQFCENSNNYGFNISGLLKLEKKELLLNNKSKFIKK
jgi:acetyltransferase-like isoleucine patch superfamily enzyme